MDAPGRAEMNGVGSARRDDDSRFDEAFERSFEVATCTVHRFVIDRLLRAARELRVDYESLVVWSVLAHLNVAHLVPPGPAGVEVPDATGRIRSDARRLRPIRVSHLARVTGLPRETVRRKLLRLQEAGRVAQHALGWTVDTATLEPELHAFGRESVLRLRAASRQLDEILAAALDESDPTRDCAAERAGEASA